LSQGAFIGQIHPAIHYRGLKKSLEYEKGWPTQPSSSTVSWHTKLLALAEQKEAPAQDDEVPQLNMKGEGLRLCSEKTR
jgi:hypothetical protein